MTKPNYRNEVTMFAFTTLTLYTLLRIVLPIGLLLAVSESLRRYHPEWFTGR